MREHNEAVNRLDFIEPRAEITVDYAPGTVELVTQHDGSVLTLRKLAADYDPTDRISAMSYLQTHQARGRDRHRACSTSTPRPRTCTITWRTVDTPLNQLTDAELVPGSSGSCCDKRLVAIAR